VTGVLEPYAHKHEFTVFGFGGKPNYLKNKDLCGKVSRCWNLTGIGSFDGQ